MLASSTTKLAPASCRTCAGQRQVSQALQPSALIGPALRGQLRRAERRVQRRRLTASEHGDRDCLTGLLRTNRRLQGGTICNGFAVEGRDDIADLNASTLGRATGLN